MTICNCDGEEQRSAQQHSVPFNDALFVMKLLKANLNPHHLASSASIGQHLVPFEIYNSIQEQCKS